MTTVFDDLNRANETPLAGNWTAGSGDAAFNLAGNVAVPANPPGADAVSIYTGASWGNDQSSAAKLTVSGSTGAGAGLGFALRHAPAARTFYRFVTDHAASNNCEIARFVGGTYTSLVTFTRAWTNGDLWEYRVTGPASAAVLTAYHLGTLVGTFTDNSSLASGTPGIAFSSSETSASIDDWTGTDTFEVPVLKYDMSLFPKFNMRTGGRI